VSRIQMSWSGTRCWLTEAGGEKCPNGLGGVREARAIAEEARLLEHDRGGTVFADAVQTSASEREEKLVQPEFVAVRIRTRGRATSSSLRSFEIGSKRRQPTVLSQKLSLESVRNICLINIDTSTSRRIAEPQSGGPCPLDIYRYHALTGINISKPLWSEG